MSDTELDPGISEHTQAPGDDTANHQDDDDDDIVLEGQRDPSADTVITNDDDQDLPDIDFDSTQVPVISCAGDKSEEVLYAYLQKNYTTAEEANTAATDQHTKLHKLALENTHVNEQPNIAALFELIHKLTPEERAQLNISENDSGNHPLRYRNPMPSGAKKLTDKDNYNAAMRRFSQTRGESPRIPLVHSGISVELRAPGSQLAAIGMYAAINRAAQGYGVNMGGLYFSNDSFLLNEIIWRTIIADNIVWASVKEKDKESMDYWRENLTSRISYNDFDTLLLAVAQAMYPNGYKNFISSCVNPACSYTSEITLVPKNILRTNEYQLLQRNPDAFVHMARTAETQLDPSVVIDYKSKISPRSGNIFRSRNSIVFLGTPSLKTVFETGAHYAGLLHTKLKGTNSLAVLAIQNSLMGMVAHWVSRIITYRTEEQAISAFSLLKEDKSKISLDGAIIDAIDSRVILEQLLAISENDDNEKIFEIIESYAQASRLTVPAIEEHPCPVCNETGESQGINVGYRVVNPIQLFFSSTKRYLAEAQSSKSALEVI